MSKSVLAIGGHIGDMDLTAGPTLAKLVLEGASATIVALTYGERGHPRVSPEEYKVQKIAEGAAFAAGIGADFRVLDYSDGFLPDNDEAAMQVASIIRETTPDTIITHWKRSIHRDHEHAARIAERGRFLASLPIDHELPRHSVQRFLYAENWEDAEGFEPSLYVTIPDEGFELWAKAIQGQAFARGETYGFRYIDYYTALMTMRGCLAGQKRACAFADTSSPATVLAGP
ncbi:PIG-L deacetylase family protein [Actinopolymorpha alba]|uniref:PIG-L deacetylase family protein n=1 Tax=Actinopolymorpha alba TaxID=533267 RepID=UPI00036F35CD|nr:PIG-L family deacetylase [Actinopolymorpha alba]